MLIVSFSNTLVKQHDTVCSQTDAFSFQFNLKFAFIHLMVYFDSLKSELSQDI